MMTFRAVGRIPKSRGFTPKLRATYENVSGRHSGRKRQESRLRLLDPVPYPRKPRKRSGAEGTRTPDLRRAKANRHILARSSTSGDPAILQVRRRNFVRCIPARLQYTPGSQFVLGMTLPSALTTGVFATSARNRAS
jgi:hypothetical protein